MEYKIAIVDDSIESRKRVIELLNKYSLEENVLFKVFEFSDGDGILDTYKSQYDIIFMDIEMARCDGMTTALKIRNTDNEVKIIFITNSPNYAIEGYKVGALSYLVKPLKYFSFRIELKRCINECNRVKNEYIMISTISDSIRLELDDIYYIESYMHKLIYHTKNGTHEVYGLMKEIENKLTDKCFARCNSGYIVNLKHVERVKGDIVYIQGQELRMSRSKKKDFMDKLLNFYSRRLV